MRQASPSMVTRLCTVHCILPNINEILPSTNNIAKILPKFCKISSIKRFILTMDPIIIVLPQVTPAKCEIKKFRGQDPQEKVEGPRRILPPFPPTMRITLSRPQRKYKMKARVPSPWGALLGSAPPNKVPSLLN